MCLDLGRELLHFCITAFLKFFSNDSVSIVPPNFSRTRSEGQNRNNSPIISTFPCVWTVWESSVALPFMYFIFCSSNFFFLFSPVNEDSAISCFVNKLDIRSHTIFDMDLLLHMISLSGGIWISCQQKVLSFFRNTVIIEVWVILLRCVSYEGEL